MLTPCRNTPMLPSALNTNIPANVNSNIGNLAACFDLSKKSTPGK
jgi:hypothetical protein